MERQKCDTYGLGSEGSGTIIEVGEGVDSKFKNRKVAFCHDAWSQFTIQNFDDVLILDDKVDLKIAAGAYVNPFTALILIKIARESGFKKKMS